MQHLLITTPISKFTKQEIELEKQAYIHGQAHVFLIKSAAEPETVHALAGELYLSKSGWIMLNVPNSLVRGAFDALNEPGAELPTKSNGKLIAHISVIRPEEIEQIGGADKITERGHQFHYTLGPVKEVKPAGWSGVSKVWFIEVKSKSLQDLRKSYGLTPLPKENKFNFHITIGIRKKKVLQHNDVAKAAGAGELIKGFVIGDLFSKDKEPEPEIDVNKQDPLIKRIRSLPTQLPSLKRRKHTSVLSKTAEDIDVPPADQDDDFDCGPAALEAIFNHYGIEYDDLEDITESSGATEEDGTPPDYMVAEIKKHGLSVETKQGMNLTDLRNSVSIGKPVICPVQMHGGGHYVIVINCDDKNVTVRDPSTPNKKKDVPVDEFNRIWHDKDKDGKLFDHYGIIIAKGNN